MRAVRVSSVLLGALLLTLTTVVAVSSAADASGPIPSAIERAEKHVNELSKILVDLKSASASLVKRRVSTHVQFESPAVYSYSYTLHL